MAAKLGRRHPIDVLHPGGYGHPAAADEARQSRCRSREGRLRPLGGVSRGVIFPPVNRSEPCARLSSAPIRWRRDRGNLFVSIPNQSRRYSSSRRPARESYRHVSKRKAISTSRPAERAKVHFRGAYDLPTVSVLVLNLDGRSYLDPCLSFEPRSAGLPERPLRGRAGRQRVDRRLCRVRSRVISARGRVWARGEPRTRAATTPRFAVPTATSSPC